MADALDRVLEGRGKPCSPIAIALQKMKRNALCRLATYARHASQGIDHSYQEW